MYGGWSGSPALLSQCWGEQGDGDVSGDGGGDGDGDGDGDDDGRDYYCVADNGG